MLSLISVFLLVACASDTVLFDLDYQTHLQSKLNIENGRYVYDLQLDEGHCISSLTIAVASPNHVDVQKIHSRDKSSSPDAPRYFWQSIGSGRVGTENTVVSLKGNTCGDLFKIISSTAFKFISMNSVEKVIQKRAFPNDAISCSVNGPEAGKYPPDCESTPSTLCVPANSTGLGLSEGDKCGCEYDADCLSAAAPFCLKQGTDAFGQCVSCQRQTAITVPASTDKRNHIFCRLRYPSIYAFRLLNATEPSHLTSDARNLHGVTLSLTSHERLPQNTKELCDSSPAASGGDKGCQVCYTATQTLVAPFLTGVTFPAFTNFAVGDRNVFRGTFFCSKLYPLSVSGINRFYNPGPNNIDFPNRPICVHARSFMAAKLCAEPNTNVVTDCENSTDASNLWRNGLVTLNLNTVNSDPRPSEAGTPSNYNNTLEELNPDDFNGACMPCAFKPDASSPVVPYHSLCSVPLPTSPVCSIASGCAPCNTNAECYSGTPGNSADAQGGCSGRGQCTGGPNCQADGSCIFCRNNSDCNGKDKQPTVDIICDIPTGICGAAPPCNGNFGSGTSNACPTSGAPNCYFDGTCGSCATRPCSATASNANRDGPASAPSGQRADQLQCSNGGVSGAPAAGICYDCNVAGTTSGLGNQLCPAGQNCYTDGHCQDCSTTTPNCANDHLTGSLCQGGICVLPPDPCTGESRSVGQLSSGNNNGGSVPCAAGAGNCMTGGSCVVCTTATSGASSCVNDLSTQDPRCDTTTGICIQRCTGETTASGQASANAGNFRCAAGLNCMTDGGCYTCTTASGAAGSCSNDINSGESVCLPNGICVRPCDANFGVAGARPCTSDTPNCHRDGRCYKCTNDADCAANDGPPPSGPNTKCRADGVCVDPYCLHNYDCPPSRPNCGQDGNCFDCRNTTGFTCGAGNATLKNGDGPNMQAVGAVGIPNQPNCDATTGICVNYCTIDAHCTNPCEPRCQKDRGCCVECTDDNHCPFLGTTDTYAGISTHADGRLLTWRANQANFVQCNPRTHFCQPQTECDYDEHCSGAKPACSARHVCVACTADAHCSGATPACLDERCVACAVNAHCTGSNKYCIAGSCVACVKDGDCSSDGSLVCDGWECVAASASFMSASILLLALIHAFVF